jgi:uncharacterized membrane protein
MDFDREPRAVLTERNLLRALWRRTVRQACLVWIIGVPIFIVLLFFVGGGEEQIAVMSDESRWSDNSTYSGGAFLVGTWFVSIASFVTLARHRRTRVVLKRWDRLQQRRLERGRKSVRRAAALLAREFDIPDDVQVYARAIRSYRSCPVEIELRTDTRKWRLRRTASGWIHRDPARLDDTWRRT